MKFKQLIKEGGNAVSNTSRINKINVNPTLESLYRILLPKMNLTKKAISILGTTGKRKTSGDIDIAVDTQALMKGSKISNIDDLYDVMVSASKSVSKEVKDTRSLGTISFSFPITNTDGKQAGKLVQIDLFLVSNLSWANWIYFGPREEESKIKGFYRNILLGQVAKHVSLKIRKKENGENIEQERFLFIFSQGLMKAIQSRRGKKKLLKNFKSINRELISTNPNKIVKLLFGPKAKPDNLLTFEQMFAAVQSNGFPKKSKRNVIFSETKKVLLKLNVPIPNELEPF